MKRPLSFFVSLLALGIIMLTGCEGPSTPVPTRSTDATLSALALSDGTLSPVFAASTTAYTVTVGYSVTSVKLTATPTDSGVTIAYSPSQTVDLPVGDTVITATVTAADGSTTKAYTVTVTRAAFAVYVAGYIVTSSSNGVPGYWKNGAWIALPILSLATDGAVSAITTSGDSVYIGGLCMAGSTYYTGYWKDSVWTSLPTKSGKPSIISAIVVSEGSVYAVGYQTKDSYSTMGTPLFWKDGVLTELSSGAYTAATAIKIAISNDDVYVIGYCVDTDSKYVPGYWKNGTWNVLPIPTEGHPFLPMTADIAISGGNIYITGDYCRDGTLGSINATGYWKDGVWNALPPCVSGKSAYASAIAISDGSIYIGGGCATSTGDYAIGYWKDGTWTTLMDQVKQSDLKGLTVCAGTVVACGRDVTATTVVTGSSSSSTQTEIGWYWDGKTKTTLLPEGAQQSYICAIAAP